MHKSIFELFDNFKNKSELLEFFSLEMMRWNNQIKQFYTADINYGELSNFLADFKKIIDSNDSDSLLNDFFDLYRKYNFPTYSHFNSVLASKIVNSYKGAGAIYLVTLSNNGLMKLTQSEISNEVIGKEVAIAQSELNDSKDLPLAPVRSAIAEIRLNDVLDRLGKYEKYLDELKLTSQNEFNTFTKGLEGKFQEIAANYESAVRDKFELSTAVTYWHKKSKRHQYTSYAVLFFLVATLFGVVWLVFSGFCYYLNNYDLLMKNKEKFAFLDGHIKYLLLGASFTLFVWVVRVYLKVWLSQVHMRNDAAERVVMVQTYLALMVDGSVQNNEDRSIIINALFRSASDGIVKDDGMPNPIIELITKSK